MPKPDKQTWLCASVSPENPALGVAAEAAERLWGGGGYLQKSSGQSVVPSQALQASARHGCGSSQLLRPGWTLSRRQQGLMGRAGYGQVTSLLHAM